MVAEEGNEPNNGVHTGGHNSDEEIDSGSTGAPGDTTPPTNGSSATMQMPSPTTKPSPSRSCRLRDLSHSQVCDWMEGMGASTATIEAVQMTQLDGAELVFCMDTETQTLEQIQVCERQLKLEDNDILCMRIRQRVTAQAADDRHEAEMRTEAERLEERNRADFAKKQDELEMQAQLMDLQTAQEQDRAKLNDIQYEKITLKMPKAPEVKNVVDGVEPEVWSKFGVGVVAYAANRLTKLGEKYEKVFQDPTVDARALLGLATEDERKLDQAIFTAINEYAAKNIMKFIGDADDCRHGGMYSGLLVCKEVGEYVDYRSAGKRLKMLEALQNQAPIIDARQIGERIINFKAQLSRCRKTNVTVSNEAVYLGLERMIKEIACRPRLTTEMAGINEIFARDRGDGQKLMKAIIAAAGDCNELSSRDALNQVEHPDSRGSKTYGPRRGGAYAVEDNRLCIPFRENGECRDGEHCGYKHQKGVGICENEEFKKTGFCDQFGTCPHLHPWDSSRGDKRAAYIEWNKLKRTERRDKREAEAAKHSRNGSYMLNETQCSQCNCEDEIESNDDEVPDMHLEDDKLNAEVTEQLGRGCREHTPPNHELERQAAEEVIQTTRASEKMDTDESFSDLSADADVTGTDNSGHESDEGNQMTTETEDTTYNTESDDGSESISDDADMDWPRRKQEIKAQLTDEGWTSKEIQVWNDMQDDLTRAMERLTVGDSQICASVVEDRPQCRLMYDSGTFKHLAGRGARPFMANIKTLPRGYPVDTAGGVIWIKQVCDLMLNGEVIRDVLINPTDMETTLLSEGILALFEKWEFHLNWEGKQVTMPDGSQHWAWRDGAGVLFYVPNELLPKIHGQSEPDDTGERGEAMGVEGPVSELDFEIEQIDKMIKLFEIEALENNQDTVNAVTRFGTAVTTGTELTVDVDAEALQCTHKPKVPGCDACEQSYIQAAPARASNTDSADYETNTDNMNSDLIILQEPDCNGNVAMYHGFLTKGKVGYVAGMKDKASATSAKHGRISKSWMQHTARAGGRLDYIISSEKSDQGSEFKGAYKAQNLSEEEGVSVWQTMGDADRHECGAQIENENKWLAVEATAMSITGTANEDQMVAVAGEALIAARGVLNHTIRGKKQKELGRTGWELLASEEAGTSREMLKTEPKFMSLVYCIVKKKDRRGKTTPRAFKALYCSADIEVPGAVRVIPFKRDIDTIDFYPTEVVFSYKTSERMPLLEAAERGVGDGDDDGDDDEDDDGFNRDGDEDDDENKDGKEDGNDDDDDGAEGEGSYEDNSKYEVEAVVDSLTHADGSVEYQLKFKGYDETEWVTAEKARGCKKLIREYETVEALKELGRGSTTSRRGESWRDITCAMCNVSETELAASVELSVNRELQGPNRAGVLKAEAYMKQNT